MLDAGAAAMPGACFQGFDDSLMKTHEFTRTNTELSMYLSPGIQILKKKQRCFSPKAPNCTSSEPPAMLKVICDFLTSVFIDITLSYTYVSLHSSPSHPPLSEYFLWIQLKGFLCKAFPGSWRLTSLPLSLCSVFRPPLTPAAGRSWALCFPYSPDKGWLYSYLPPLVPGGA